MERQANHAAPPSQPRGSWAVSSGGGGEPPSKVHLVLALVGGVALIAVPLVLWLRPPAPDPVEPPQLDAAPVQSAPPAPVDTTAANVANALERGVKTEHVTLGPVWIDSCQRPGPGRTPPDQCDRQPWFEQALVRAVLENTACAPSTRDGGSVSVALKADFRRKKLRIFAGNSGSIRGRAARGLIRCVQRSFPEPSWESLEHEHTKYVLGVLATYPPSSK